MNQTDIIDQTERLSFRSAAVGTEHTHVQLEAYDDAIYGQGGRSYYKPDMCDDGHEKMVLR